MSKTLFTYEFLQFRDILDYFSEKKRNVISASSLDNTRIQKIKDEPEKYIVDITSMVCFLSNEENLSFVFRFEQLIDNLPNETLIICDASVYTEAVTAFRYIFLETEPVKYTRICTDAPVNHFRSSTVPEIIHDCKKLIVDCGDEELDYFLETISKNLIGHQRFKDELKKKIINFRLYHSIGEQKIFSIFIMGDSGIGKTEVGRLMLKGLSGTSPLCKISFGNYSSKDSLNSLIGSPRGYTGSETGELQKKLRLSDTGIILIDEFEKADNPVFNFFLDLLEEGKFTDSQADVYDLDGYIFVFTSNLNPKTFFERISPELISRFDYVCLFNPLSTKDKEEFLITRVNRIITKFESTHKTKLSLSDRTRIINEVEYHKENNLRKINNDIRIQCGKVLTEHLANRMKE